MKQVSPLRTESTVLGNQKHILALNEDLTSLLFIKWRAFGNRMTINYAWEYLIGKLIKDASRNEVKLLASFVQRRGSSGSVRYPPLKTLFPLWSVICRNRVVR